MSVDKVREYLKQWNMEDAVMEFEQSSATVELAAAAVGVIPARIAKTLSFLLKDGRCALVVTAGDAKIDNHKFKEYFGCKAKMPNGDQVVDYTGHAIGGVCPFAIENPMVDVYLDNSLRRFETVYPAAGSSSSAVPMTCEALFTCGNARDWIDVCRVPVKGEEA